MRTTLTTLVILTTAGALALASCSSSGVSDGQAAAITTTTNVTDTAASTSATAAGTTAVAGAATTAPATTVKVVTTKPPTPKTTVAPTLAVTSVSASYTTFPCSLPAPHTITLTWKTTLADSVTISIDNPNGPYQTGLPASGSLEVPFSACPSGTVKYYIAARNSATNDQSTREIDVKAGA